MSEYGLLVKNSSGAIQIDSTYKNYSLYEHGEGVTTVQDTPASYYIVDVTFANATSYQPLIALKPSSTRFCGLLNFLTSGSNYTGFRLVSESNYAATVDWMAFVPNETISSNTYGMRVYNDSGVLVFDSGYTPMVILDVDTCNPGYNDKQTITHPSDSNAYFIVSTNGIWEVLTGGSWPPGSLLIYYHPMMKYISATELSFGGNSTRGGYLPTNQSASGGYWPSTWTILTVKKAF